MDLFFFVFTLFPPFAYMAHVYPASGCKQPGERVDNAEWENPCCNDLFWLNAFMRVF